jgi:hypothetical protein
MFDHTTIRDGRSVERSQQSDTLRQMRRMYVGAAKRAGMLAGGLLAAALALGATRRLVRRSSPIRWARTG